MSEKRWAILACTILFFAFALIERFAWLGKSPAFDEPVHQVSARAQIDGSDFRIDPRIPRCGNTSLLPARAGICRSISTVNFSHLSSPSRATGSLVSRRCTARRAGDWMWKVGIILGLGAGLELSVDARRLTGTVLGYSPPLVLPWLPIALGCLAVMTVSISASLWPALNVARAEPLELLQAGRASI